MSAGHPGYSITVNIGDASGVGHGIPTALPCAQHTAPCLRSEGWQHTVVPQLMPSQPTLISEGCVSGFPRVTSTEMAKKPTEDVK